MGFSFVDTDQYIEAALGRSIPELFAREGEDFFRAQELAAAGSWPGGRGWSWPAAGGLPTRRDSIACLKRSGTVVFLRRDPGRSLTTSPWAGRPLGQQGREAFLERYAGREPIYLEWADRWWTYSPPPRRPPGGYWRC